jgi:hypothetical protein
MEGGPTKTRALLLAAAALAAGSALHPSPLHADDGDAPARVVARPGEPAGAGTRAVPGPATDAAAPDGPEAARREPAREDRRWARSVFFDLRGRGPRPDELEAVLAVPPGAAVDRLLSDRATWEAWVERELYFYLLIDRFRPVSDRVVALPGLLAAGECTVRDATREIVVSAEFNTRNPGNDTFVTVVLEQLLGMVVQEQPRVLEAGKKMYDGALVRLFGEAGRTQADVVRIVLAQPRFSERFVARQYRAMFARDPSKEDLARDAARFHADPSSWRGILRGWVLSDAYRARTLVPRPKSDLVFIRTLFSDLLGREPTFEEFRNSRNAFLALSDPTPVRNVLGQLLLESGRAPIPGGEPAGRPAAWVAAQFRRLLGRDPTGSECDAFVATLGEYGCDPRTLILAVVTSPEYQYY